MHLSLEICSEICSSLSGNLYQTFQKLFFGQAIDTETAEIDWTFCLADSYSKNCRILLPTPATEVSPKVISKVAALAVFIHMMCDHTFGLTEPAVLELLLGYRQSAPKTWRPLTSI
jgi:hypothetical protein